MANRQRVVLLALAAVVALIALVVVGGSGDDEDAAVIDTRTTATTESTPGTMTTEDNSLTVTTKPQEASEPKTPVVVIRNGAPVGGVERLRFRKGGDIVFDVRADAAGHVHLHGYDVLKDLVPGKRVRFDVPAKIDGSFELELEDTATLVAEIEVVP